MKKVGFLLFLHIFCLSSRAQILHPTSWAVHVSPEHLRIGEAYLTFEVFLEKGWYIYGTDFDPNLGPMLTTFHFDSNQTYKLEGNIISVDPKKKYDDLWGGEYTFFSEKGLFSQKLTVLDEDFYGKVTILYQVCTEVDGKCIPLEEELTFGDSMKTKKVITNSIDKNTESILSDSLDPGRDSLWLFIIYAFSVGLIAIFTPCVFPMIPLTVSFFSQQGRKKGTMQGKVQALLYGLSIILIYTFFGVLVSPLAGPAFANEISTHWLPNSLFFIVFFTFALSLFGLFDIVLPQKFINRIDSASEKNKGFLAIFFMAFTLVLVSFSCTGPLIGSLLVESAGGKIVKPVVGMFFFGLAFGLPFSLFAFFPSLLIKLPQSGGWLNSVKVTLGFIELALAFKFLSLVDQVYHLGILNREINIAIWIAISVFMALYYLNKIKLPHDDPSERVSVFRFLLALVCFSFTVYLIPGMFGAPLKALSGYLPPQTSHSYDLKAIIRNESQRNAGDFLKIKYGENLKLPHGLKGYFDLGEAKSAAESEQKPIFIDFTGHACVNCRKMEEYVWSDTKILDLLRNKYIVLALYVDDKQVLPRTEWKQSLYDGEWKKTIGQINTDYQITKFNNNAQPFYVLIDHEEKILASPRAYDLNIQNFVSFLDTGLAAFKRLSYQSEAQ